jgi:uncharacterized protein YbgA (DUF1722 family)
MEVPRPPLVQIRDRGIRVVSGDGVDWTEALTAACEETLTRLAERDLCGYIVKDCSPTCGATRVRVEDGGRREVEGVGVFTRALRQRLPNLPIEAETHLHDPTVRDGFLDAVFAHARWHAVRQSGLTAARLAAFHARNIYLLWAHSPTHANKLAAIVEAARVEAAHAEPTCEQLSAELGRRYQVLYMAAFRARATIRRHVYAMRQIAAELAPRLSARDGVEIEAVIDAYEAGAVPRRVPIALLGRHALAAGELVGHSYLLCDAD